MEIKLTRVIKRDDATIGLLYSDERIFGVTLELPWKDNQHQVSCIPEGTYPCELFDSPHLGVIYAVNNVPGRGEIRIHNGNYPKDSLGCILLADGLDVASATPAIANRTYHHAMTNLRLLLNNGPFTLVVE